MKVYIRKSSLKHRKMNGFRRKMKTADGRKTLNNQRNIAAGRPKRVKLMKARHNKRRFAKKAG